MTTVYTLSLLDPLVASLLRHAEPPRRRAFAAACAHLAVERAGLERDGTAELVGAALRLIDELSHGLEQGFCLCATPCAVAATRAALKALADRLDDEGFQLQQQRAARGLDGASARARKESRAASSLWAALDEDPLDAAATCAYEALRAADGDELAIARLARRHLRCR